MQGTLVPPIQKIEWTRPPAGGAGLICRPAHRRMKEAALLQREVLIAAMPIAMNTRIIGG
jgi:hypothetical protein